MKDLKKQQILILTLNWR